MKEYLELLGLEEERVRSIALAREGLGTARFQVALEQPESSDESANQNQVFAATTHWQNAAGCWLLLDEVRRSHVLFRRSADVLSERGQPLGVLLRALSEPERHVSWRDLHWLGLHGENRTEGASVFLLMHPAVLAGHRDVREQAISLRRRLEGVSRWRVGRLGLPAKIYLDIFDAMGQGERTRTSALVSVLQQVLMTFDELLTEAMRDKYHWQRVISFVRPVEPEVAALMVSVSVALRPSGVDLVPFAMKGMDVSNACRVLMEGIVQASSPT